MKKHNLTKRFDIPSFLYSPIIQYLRTIYPYEIAPSISHTNI